MVSRGKSKRRRENNVRAAKVLGQGATGPLPPAPAPKDIHAIPPGLRRIMEFSAAMAGNNSSSKPSTVSSSGNRNGVSRDLKADDVARRNGQNGRDVDARDSRQGSKAAECGDMDNRKDGADGVGSKGGNGDGSAEGGVEEEEKRKKRKVMEVGDWRVEAMQGGISRGGGERKKALNSKKKEFLNSKKSRKKRQVAGDEWAPSTTEGDQKSTALPPSTYFGAVVQAPPKLSVRPKVRGQEVAKKAPGIGTALARHFAGTLGPQGERKEMLRQQAVEFYRRKKETEKSHK